MATGNKREVKRVGGEFHDSDKNKHTEEPFSERNCCDHKQAGQEGEIMTEQLQSLFTHMSRGGTKLSRKEHMNALSKLKRMRITDSNNVMVIRTSDSDKKWLWDEIKNGRLLQGWGITNTQLMEDGQRVGEDAWIGRYADSAKKVWGEEISKDGAKKRYRILSRMLELKKGDYVVIPKMPSGESFVIAKVSGDYTFDTADANKRQTDDFRHVVPIADHKIINYYACEDSRRVKKTLRGYQSAVNRINSKTTIEVIQSLYNSSNKFERADSVKNIFSTMRQDTYKTILEKVRGLPSRDLEMLIESAFESNGFSIEETNHYDGLGGDADLVVSLPIPILSDVLDFNLKVFIQAKQKSGKDWDEEKGIDQLIKISADEKFCLRILISTSDDLSPAARAKADEHDVFIVSDVDTARLLSKFV